MQLTFIGAAEGVTGSCALLADERLRVRFLVDCGAHAERNAGIVDGSPRLPFAAKLLDFVVLTHAHRDHVGRLPQLHRAGFRGPVYCTGPTAWMTRLALLDAAKFSREYEASDVELIDFQALDRRPHFAFDQPMRLHGVTLTLHRSAHILGAVALTVGWRSRIGNTRSIVFSGDIGGNTPANPYQSLLAGQTLPGEADYMVVESTRGSEPARAAHYKSFDKRMAAWSGVFADSDARGGGPVIAPCFAIHRAQELLFDLGFVLRTTSSGRPDAEGRPRWIALNAPLAAQMTDVYGAMLGERHEPTGTPRYRNPELAHRLRLADEGEVDVYLAALWDRMRHNRAPSGTLRALRDATLSRIVALAGGGMCEGGRIVDLIVDQITNPAATIVLCGHAPPETGTGRLRQFAAGDWSDSILPLGNARIEIDQIQARLVDFGDYYSGHGDIDALIRFVFERDEPVANARPATVFLNHGDNAMRAGLAQAIHARAAAGSDGDRTIENVVLPRAYQTHDLDVLEEQRRAQPRPKWLGQASDTSIQRAPE